MRPPRCAGLVEVNEGQRLRELAAGVPRGSAIVEIGSHTGLSTCWMAATTDAPVFAVDPWGDPRPDSLDDPFGFVTGDNVLARFLANIEREGHREKVTPLRSTSTVVAAMWVRPVGLVFIDAVHEYGPVRDDYLAWAPFVPAGGWLAFHDFNPWPEHPYFGVSQAIDEFVTPSGLWGDPTVVGSLWTAQRLP